MTDAATWTGVVILTILIGSYAIWWWDRHSRQRDNKFEADWRARMTPNADGNLTRHRHPDEADLYGDIPEPAELPDDYRDWQKPWR